jgi:hypothetical protein
VGRAANASEIKAAIRIEVEVAMEVLVLVGICLLPPCLGRRLMKLALRISPPLRTFPAGQRVMEAVEKHHRVRVYLPPGCGTWGYPRAAHGGPPETWQSGAVQRDAQVFILDMLCVM